MTTLTSRLARRLSSRLARHPVRATEPRAGGRSRAAGVRVEVYSSEWCGYCRRALRLLDARGVDYVRHDVDGDDALRAEMVRRAGRRTVPQIFIDGVHIGGCDELLALDRAGRLDALLEPG